MMLVSSRPRCGGSPVISASGLVRGGVLPALDGIHDLLGPHPQVTLGDLGLGATFTCPLANLTQKALSLFEKGPLALVAREGFEPSTSRL
jgi:hypothetical protein